MVADALSGMIENNKEYIAKLEEKKEKFDEGIELSKKKMHNFLVQRWAFLRECGVTDPLHLNREQKLKYEGLTSDYWSAKKSYNFNLCSFLSTNNTIFDLVLDNGKLQCQQLVFNNIAKNYESNG